MGPIWKDLSSELLMLGLLFIFLSNLFALTCLTWNSFEWVLDLAGSSFSPCFIISLLELPLAQLSLCFPYPSGCPCLWLLQCWLHHSINMHSWMLPVLFGDECCAALLKLAQVWKNLIFSPLLCAMPASDLWKCIPREMRLSKCLEDEGFREKLSLN